MEDNKVIVIALFVLLLIVGIIATATTIGARTYQERATERVSICIESGATPLECAQVGTLERHDN